MPSCRPASRLRRRTICADRACSANYGLPAVTISVLPEVLRWIDDPIAAVGAVENRYVEALGARLGEVLASICRTDAALGGRLAAQVDAADAHELRASLLAPETSRRLVTGMHGFDEVRDHLVVCLDGHREEPATMSLLAGRIPVVAEPAPDPRLDGVLRHAESVLALLAQGCPPAATFVRRTMRRLVLRLDEGRPGFASNSPQGLVGLAILSNGHLPMVDDIVVVEALVHETIHGFVGMSEAIGLAGRRPDERWLNDDRFYEGFSCTVSPWTGTSLDLPTYLHACFVWWGLLHLWGTLSGSGLFDERRTRSRLVRAARGFKDSALLLPLRPHLAALHPSLVTIFDKMGGEVDELIVESGLDLLMARLDAVATP